MTARSETMETYPAHCFGHSYISEDPPTHIAGITNNIFFDDLWPPERFTNNS